MEELRAKAQPPAVLSRANAEHWAGLVYGRKISIHLTRAVDNGVTKEELIEALTHLAFYAGWPKAMAAMGVAKQVFRGQPE